MKDAENKFISFLEERGVFEEFKANLMNSWGSDGFASFEAWIKSTNPRNFTLDAFSWGCASEEEKWGAIHYKWQDFIKQDGAE